MSAFDNGIPIVRGMAVRVITITCGMEVRVARGGYTTLPPTIGDNNWT